MRILQIHNRYQQPGGEDSVVAAEARLLRDQGHTIIQYAEDNSSIPAIGHFRLAGRVIWSRQSYSKILHLSRYHKIDLAHFHNTFPLVSPSGYWACKKAGVSVVQTLHNYRLVCPSANLFRQGSICEQCLARTVPWPAIQHGCYRDSRVQSSGAAAIITLHRWLGTWSKSIDVFIALTEFSRSKFVQAGLPSDKIVVKPNFVYPDPGPKKRIGDYVLYVGRLSPEKGILTLLEAWKQLDRIPLKIVGDGPLMEQVRETVRSIGDHIELVGKVPRSNVGNWMNRAQLLISPSMCYESFPVAVVEAFARGLPVLMPRHGSFTEFTEDRTEGTNFHKSSPIDLAHQVRSIWGKAAKLRELGDLVRKKFERAYSSEMNYQQLENIYESARSNHSLRVQ